MPLLVFKKYSYSLTRGTYLTFREKKLCEKFPSLLTLSIERDSWTEHSAVEYKKLERYPISGMIKKDIGLFFRASL